MEYRSFLRGVTGLAFGKPMTGTTHRVARSHSTNCLGFNFQTARKPIAVIPGWSAEPDPESRDSGFDAIGPRVARTRCIAPE